METLRFLYSIKPQDIAYLRWILESYDGMAVVKTVDPRAGVVELRIAPGCEGLMREILDSLRGREKLRMTPVKTSQTHSTL